MKFNILNDDLVNRSIRETTSGILDRFENLLDEKDIDIPSEDRDGEKSEARLYGTEYYTLEDEINDIIRQNVKYIESYLEEKFSSCLLYRKGEISNEHSDSGKVQDDKREEK